MFSKVIPFHLLTTRNVLQVVSPDNWFILINLKDAFFHVPIAPHQFLCFVFQGRHIQFRVRPFLLTLSSCEFTQSLAAALYALQAKGQRILAYLDDWLVCASTEAQAAGNTRKVLGHIDLLGHLVNWQKSNLVR